MRNPVLFVPMEIGEDPLTFVFGTFGSEPIRIFSHPDEEAMLAVLAVSGIETLAQAKRAYALQCEEEDCSSCSKPVGARGVEIAALWDWPTGEPQCVDCMRSDQDEHRKSMTEEEIDQLFESDLYKGAK